MKRAFLAAALATLMVSAHAADDSDGRWFGDGLAWYEHSCGHNPALCSKLFP